MVDYIHIKHTLILLDSKYSEDGISIDMQILYSKLALLELCGWIEVSFDAILNEYIDKQQLMKKDSEYIKEFIQNNWGFHYDKNVFSIFCHTIGIVLWDSLQSKINTDGKLELLKSTLNNFTKKRGIAAHTNISVTQTYDSPSTILTNYDNIKDIIKFIEQFMQNLCPPSPNLQ